MRLSLIHAIVLLLFTSSMTLSASLLSDHAWISR